MSYCRWSSDNYQCDVYVYEDCGGWWQIYIAGRRRRLLEGVSFPPYPADGDVDAWVAHFVKVSEMIRDENEGKLWEWVDLPDFPDGDSFREDTPGDCADRLEQIRDAGFNVPQGAIDALREEAAEATA